MHTKLYLLKSKGQIRKDGTAEIKIYYKHKDKNPVYFNTKVYIQPHQLSDKGIINHPDSRSLNLSLAKVKNTYENIIIKFIGEHRRKPSATELKQYVSSEEIQDQLKYFQNTYQRANFNQIRLKNGDIVETDGNAFEVDLLDLEKLYVEATQNTKILAEREADRKKRWLIHDFNKYLEHATIKDGTRKIYEQTVKHLESFTKLQPVSSYNDINLSFFQEFLLFLHHTPTRYNENMADNTILNHLRNLNAFLNHQSDYITDAHPCNLKRFKLNDNSVRRQIELDK